MCDIIFEIFLNIMNFLILFCAASVGGYLWCQKYKYGNFVCSVEEMLIFYLTNEWSGEAIRLKLVAIPLKKMRISPRISTTKKKKPRPIFSKITN